MKFSDDKVIIARDLVKIYETKVPIGLFRRKKKKVTALKGVSLEVYEGEIFGLLGPNGAGKTTLIKILTTLLLPDSGYAIVNGYDVVKQSEEVRKSVGVMLMGERSLYWKLTGRENLEFFGSLYKIPRDILKRRINEIIEFLEIEEFVDRLVETYSSGQRVLLAFAKALINDAPIIFLDEPTVALDPRRTVGVRQKIKKLKEEGKTIFLTTHIMQEAEELCDRVAIIDEGKIVAVGTPNELKRTLKGKSAVEVDIIYSKPELITGKIKAIEGVHKVAWDIISSERGQVVKIRAICDNPREILPSILEILLSNDIRIQYIKPEEPTLEDVFLYYTGKLLS